MSPRKQNVILYVSTRLGNQTDHKQILNLYSWSGNKVTVAHFRITKNVVTNHYQA